MLPNYVAKKSAIYALKWWLVLPSCLIIPLLAVLIYNLIVPENELSSYNMIIIIATGVLCIPLIAQIIWIIRIKCWSILFYDTRYVIRDGFFKKEEKHNIFFGIYKVRMYQPFFGLIFNFGDIWVECPGGYEWDSKLTECIKNPEALKRYLESRIGAKGITDIKPGNGGIGIIHV